MKCQISEKKMCNAFLKAGLGSEDDYANWTPIWALHGRIWQTKKLRRGAHDWFGDLGVEAVRESDPEAIRKFAETLERVLEAERDPGYAVLADIFFAVEELNDLGKPFTKAKLLSWLNDEMEAVLTSDEVQEALVLMELSRIIPRGKGFR